jgi:chromosome segregation protein
VHGFKSFAKKTELPFTPEINVILGPNGSGKSNVADALCFVLGRLSIKSMRAAKAKNLIFLGAKEIPPAKEASVEIIFDNANKEFSLNEQEISIKRIVRRNGQSIYRINDETKTRQEVLNLLAQAGIDPNGFNIILQGEIQNFVRMHGEERRKVIEEVSGISVYETRKEKSLKELEKTDEKLKEVMAILRERTSYLANLEKERQQALKFKKLEADVKTYRASIIYHDLSRKKKEAENIESQISKKNQEIEKQKKARVALQTTIESLKSKINSINSTIQKSTGLEQEKLNQEIANLRAELAGMNVKLENHESRFSGLLKSKQDFEETIRKGELELFELQKESPSKFKSQKEIELKKKELEKLEEERKKFYTTRSELKSFRERIQDKKTILQAYVNESEFLLKQIKSMSSELFDRKTDSDKLHELRLSLAEKRQILEALNANEKELEKLSYSNEHEIEKEKKLLQNISKMDICPICKNKITKEHVSSISKEIMPRIESLRLQIENSDKKLSEIESTRQILKQELEQITAEITKREADLVVISHIEEKKNQIKAIQEKIDASIGEISVMEKKRKALEGKFDENSNVEQKCETVRMEIQDISLRSKENVSSEISFKQRELERLKISLKQIFRDEAEITEELGEIRKKISSNENLLEQKKSQEEELNKKFQKLIAEVESLSSKIRENEFEVSSRQNHIYNLEQEINSIKIDKARIGAEVENLETEMLSFSNIEIIKINKDSLMARLNKAQEELSKIGSVNLRSLEVYDSIKQEYDIVKEKVDIISREKEGILKIIQEIDIKKKNSFMKTLNSLNEAFTRNFSQLSTKGIVFLDIENRKEPFEGGVNITVKTGHGKYFDVKSLSGGEQTIVALSLIFAIQELNPYYFYILDEIDAALDKRNSARLAGLLKKYMEKGQYIVITHNDEVITNASNLYGVSMNDGVSKVVSLKI